MPCWKYVLQQGQHTVFLNIFHWWKFTDCLVKHILQTFDYYLLFYREQGMLTSWRLCGSMFMGLLIYQRMLLQSLVIPSIMWSRFLKFFRWYSDCCLTQCPYSNKHYLQKLFSTSGSTCAFYCLMFSLLHFKISDIFIYSLEVDWAFTSFTISEIHRSHLTKWLSFCALFDFLFVCSGFRLVNKTACNMSLVTGFLACFDSFFKFEKSFHLSFSLFLRVNFCL